MTQHLATIAWSLPATASPDDFKRGKYSREHTWTFDGGQTIPASPSPAVVPKPWSNPAHVDPEEAFVASVASCHMLTYLWVASKQGFHITAYTDAAVGTMTKNEKGVMWLSQITLHPKITYTGDNRPTPEQETNLHHQAHDQCFIANSVKTEITVAPPTAV